MIVTEVVIQTQPGRAPAVEAHLEKDVPGFQSRRVEGGDCIHGSWCVPSGRPRRWRRSCRRSTPTSCRSTPPSSA